MTATTTDRRERLRERYVLDTKFNAKGYYEIWIGRTPQAKAELVAVTRDQALYEQALSYENDACSVDCWIVRGRPQGTTADAVLMGIRLSESNS